MEKFETLVSIGLPVYNGEKYLDKTINCLISQSYKNIELIISDNCSVDHTPLICKRFLKKDKRIRYFRQKSNIGAINNFNFVFRRAKGQYFMWASHDDYWHKDYILLLTNLLKKNLNYDFVISNYCFFDEKHSFNTSFKLKKNYWLFNQNKYIYNYIEQYAQMHDAIDYAIFRKDFLVKNGLLTTDLLRKLVGNKNTDIFFTFNCALNGQYGIEPRILFYKRDVKGYFDIFLNLKKHNLSLEFIKKSLIFIISQPILYFFDFIYLIYYTCKSRWNLLRKSGIILFLFIDLIKKEIAYPRALIKGMFYYFAGFFHD